MIDIINNNFNDLAKDYYQLQEEYEKQQQEIERLNKQIEEYQKALDETTSKKMDLENIINELEEWLEKQKTRNSEWNNFVMIDGRLGIPISYLLNKLQELKGSDKE